MNRIKQAIMRRYCPEYEAKMPVDEAGLFRCDAIVVWGYWGHHSKVVDTKRVWGKQEAYMTARWMALKAQFWRPQWFEETGINYGITKL